MCEEDIESIASEIMTYLHRRPLATDSLEGIAHWWLVQQAIEKKMEMVEQALEYLIEQGKVSKQMNTNRAAVYRLHPAYRPGEE